MARKAWWAVFVVGVVMMATPFALGMPRKVADGQAMMNDFRPIMQAQSVDTTATYLNDVFVPLGTAMAPVMTQANVDKFDAYLSGMARVQTEAPNLVAAVGASMGLSATQAQQLIDTQFPGVAAMFKVLPTMGADFSQLLALMGSQVDRFAQVPAGLAHMQPLVRTMQRNVDTFASADSLPNMRLFTFFFAVPGLLLFGIAGWELFGHKLHHAVPMAARPTPIS